ncbi:hypothetical protein [Niveibacterium sp.]|uniref:hypothetical protein n=1 Tax=Niveibacterium sp. TaxID=2017444 RepID=UPI0035AF22CF
MSPITHRIDVALPGQPARPTEQPTSCHSCGYLAADLPSPEVCPPFSGRVGDAARVFGSFFWLKNESAVICSETRETPRRVSGFEFNDFQVLSADAVVKAHSQCSSHKPRALGT